MSHLAQAWNDDILYQEVFEAEEDAIEWFGQLNALAIDETFSFLLSPYMDDVQ